MSNTNENVGYAEARALERRQRLLQLKRKAQGKTEVTEETDESKSVPEESNENNVTTPEAQSEETSNPPEKESIELDFSNLASRKIDWDLKRDIESKLEILQERTSEAIAELIRNNMVDDI